LDPRLFRNGKLDTSIRQAVLQLVLNQLNTRYTAPEAWSRTWIAGSGVSYQWAAQRDPGDLDCLIGVDFPRFRQSNTKFVGLSDKEIAEMMNEEFRNELHPRTELFLGAFELTFYVNAGASDIRSIKPYAAYSVTDDLWTVPPSPMTPETDPAWEAATERDRLGAIDILTRYISAKNLYDSATNEAVKANARSQMRVAMTQGVTLYDSLHEERSDAFSPGGSGYADYSNYRWQAGKRSGVVQSMRDIKKQMQSDDEEFAQKYYGGPVTDAQTLIRRAATARK
jgi:hypothetical protein